MTQRVINFTEKNFKFMLANMTADDVIHDYGIGKEDRWEANKDLLLQFQSDRYTFMNPRVEGGGVTQSILVNAPTSPTSHLDSFDQSIHPNEDRIIFPFLPNSLGNNSTLGNNSRLNAQYYPSISLDPHISEEQKKPIFFDNLVKHELAYYNALDLLVEDVKTEILFIIFSNIINRRKLEFDTEVKSNSRKRKSIATEGNPDSIKSSLMDLYYYITDGSEFMEDIYLKFAGYLNNNQKYLVRVLILQIRKKINKFKLNIQNKKLNKSKKFEIKLTKYVLLGEHTPFFSRLEKRVKAKVEYGHSAIATTLRTVMIRNS
jgi:hypothetical protein